MLNLKENPDNLNHRIYEQILIAIGFVLNPIFTWFLRRKKRRREIAANISVSSDWSEITFNPEKCKRDFQSVLLRIPGCQRDPFDNKGFKLADGTIINPEVIIFDEYENKHQLTPSLHFGRPDSLDREKLSISAIGFKSKEMPKDRKYVKIRLRNDIPFHCSIDWLDYDLK